MVKKDILGLDSETAGPETSWRKGSGSTMVEASTALVAGYSVAWNGHSEYVRVNHPDGRREDAKEYLRSLLADDRWCFIAVHNLGYDSHVFARFLGLSLEELRELAKDRFIDTMLLARLLNQGEYVPGKEDQRLGLKVLAKKHLGVKLARNFEEHMGPRILVAGPSDEQIDFIYKNLPPGMRKGKKKELRSQQVWRACQSSDVKAEGEFEQYAKYDAEWTRALAYKFLPRLYLSSEYSKKMREAFFGWEMPLVWGLADCYSHGVRLNVEGLEDVKAKLEERISQLRAMWEEELPGVSITSAPQVRKALFESGIWPSDGAEKTPAGEISTSTKTMKWLSRVLPPNSRERHILEVKQEFNKLEKLRNTYCDSLMRQAKIRGTGRIHMDHFVAGTNTFRFRMSSPNCLALPRGTDFDIRKCFEADPGWTFVQCDIGAAEIVIGAFLSQDPNLCAALNQGIDMHTNTATMLGIPRPLAKIVNLGKQYGMGAISLTGHLGKSPFRDEEGRMQPDPEVKAIDDRWQATYQGLIQYAKRCGDFVERNGFIENVAHYRMVYPDYRHTERWVRSAVRRKAANATIQSLVSTVMRKAIPTMYRRYREASIPCHLVLLVHDEAIVAVPDEHVEASENIMKDVIAQCWGDYISMPCKLEPCHGKNLREVK